MQASTDGLAVGAACVAGRERLYVYCAEHGIAFQRCGKLIVATSDDQRAGLNAAGASGPQRRRIPAVDLATSPQWALRCVDALHCRPASSTAIARRAGGRARAAGATSRSRPVTGGRVTTNGIALIGGAEATELVARGVVNCAGHDAQRVARSIGVCRRTACRRPTPRAPTGPPAAPFTTRVSHARPRVRRARDARPRRSRTFWSRHQWVDAIDYRVDPTRAARFYPAIRVWPDLRTARW
jgi:hypothetical protein